MRSIIIVFLLFIFFKVEAQNNTFYRRYNISGMQGGLGIIETPDGGFVGVGQHENNGSAGNCDVYAYKVDACGNLEWMKLIGTSGVEGGKSIFRRANGDLLIVGHYDPTGFLIELDMNGNLQWEKRYNGVSWTMAVTEDAGNNLYLTGVTSSPSQYVVFKCDPTGNVLWSNIYSNLGYMATSILSVSPNHILVLAAYAVPGGDFSLNYLDANGNTIWSKTFGGTGFSDVDANAWGCKAIVDRTGNFAYVVSQTAVFGSDNILVAKINISNGTEVWSRIIGDAGSEQPRDVVLTDDGIAVLGNSNGYGVTAGSAPGVSATMGERDILLVKLDDQGNKIWDRTYGAEERDKGIGLRHNDDGSFLISAYTSSPFFGNSEESMDPLFIRTDSLGMVACQVHSPNVTVQPFTMTIATNGTASPISVSAFTSNSIVSNYTPVDSYQCLTCITDPVFVPSDTTVCVNDTVFFYNTTTNGLTCFQRWSLDGYQLDGSLDTISFTFVQPGIYPVLLYSNCGNSNDTFLVNIRVNPFPAPAFSTQDNCFRDTTRFTNLTTIPSGTIASYEWTIGNSTISNLTSPSYLFNQPGIYPVTLKAVSDKGCSKLIQDSVIIYPLPRPSFTVENVCDRDSIHAVNNSTGNFPIVSYDWLFSDGFNSSDFEPSHLFNRAGRYYVQLNVTDIHSCKERFTDQVDIYPLPKPNFFVSRPSCDYYSFAEFENRSSNFIYLRWNFGDGDSSNLRSPVHRYDSAGFFEVVLHLTSDKGCVDSLIDRIEVKEEFSFWVPNAFTPNGDNLNDIFKPLYQGVKSFSMSIFNRWGSCIFETNDISNGWDGRGQNQIAQKDVYVYRISVTDNCNDEHSYVGRVTLIN